MIQTYTTRREARKAARKMRGWAIRIITTDRGEYAIQCNGSKYLRTDGYVR